MALLELRKVGARYPGLRNLALSDISLRLGPEQLVVVLGPSGSGKTTLLNLIAGFALPASGQITLNGNPVSGPGADRGVVFQQDALLPWQTVLENAAFGLALRGVPRAEREEQARRQLALVGLEGFEHRNVWQLSGGQKQRVGIARALTADPSILLLDEPFGALDAFIREQAQELLLNVWQKSEKPIFLITHEIEEAVFLATDLIILGGAPGRIVERLTLPFGRRYAAGEPVRQVKSAPDFIAAREHVLQQVFQAHHA